jgi:hypothetical protein
LKWYSQYDCCCHTAGLLRRQDRRLPLPRQILEGGGLEQRLVELTPLEVGHLGERLVADDLSRRGGLVRRSASANSHRLHSAVTNPGDSTGSF